MNLNESMENPGMTPAQPETTENKEVEGNLSEAIAIERKLYINQLREVPVRCRIKQRKGELKGNTQNMAAFSKYKDVGADYLSTDTAQEELLRGSLDEDVTKWGKLEDSIQRNQMELAKVQPQDPENKKTIEALRKDMEEFAKDDQAKEKLALFAKYQKPPTGVDELYWNSVWSSRIPALDLSPGRGGGEASNLVEIVYGLDWEISKLNGIGRQNSQEAGAYQAALKFVEDNCDGRFQNDPGFLEWQKQQQQDEDEQKEAA